MKTGKLIIASVASIALLASCGSGSTENTEETNATATTEAHSGEFQINTDASKVMWKGTMMGMYSHTGTVPFNNGKLIVENGKFVGGEFVVDLTTITPTDENYSEEKPKEKLVGHLSSPDFFDVANHPTATFQITGQQDSLVMGNLTIRGNTHQESAVITKHDMENHVIEATLTFDRTKYGVNFKHPMQEMVLSNDIELNIHLEPQQVENTAEVTETTTPEAAH